ncbi:MAG TPA: DUF4003 family protein [Pseudogracilibacillus sp.]|nr:DUF4003 family protein [Pseudogracilibacillus sp.]
MDHLQHKDKIMTYIQLFNDLKHQMKWKITDNRILMAMASLYVMNDKTLDPNRLLEIADNIKKRANLFSAMKSHSRFTTAAFLDANFNDPIEQIENLFHYYDLFKQEKFQRGVFTYIAASIIVKNQAKAVDPREIILKTKSIYQGMKKEHPFLTSASDYPLATLLAYEQHPNIVRKVEVFYDGLSKNGFRKGNDLQFISHILALSRDETENTLMNRSTQIFDQFKKIGIKPKSIYYPVMGMLALLPQDMLNMQEIYEIYDQLNHEKYFKWQKDTNLMMAASFIVKDKLEHSNIAETSIYTTIEMIIQAQQAVMIAVMASISVSNTNNGN